MRATVTVPLHDKTLRSPAGQTVKCPTVVGRRARGRNPRIFRPPFWTFVPRSRGVPAADPPRGRGLRDIPDGSPERMNFGELRAIHLDRGAEAGSPAGCPVSTSRAVAHGVHRSYSLLPLFRREPRVSSPRVAAPVWQPFDIVTKPFRP